MPASNPIAQDTAAEFMRPVAHGKRVGPTEPGNLTTVVRFDNMPAEPANDQTHPADKLDRRRA